MRFSMTRDACNRLFSAVSTLLHNAGLTPSAQRQGKRKVGRSITRSLYKCNFNLWTITRRHSSDSSEKTVEQAKRRGKTRMNMSCAQVPLAGTGAKNAWSHAHTNDIFHGNIRACSNVWNTVRGSIPFPYTISFKFLECINIRIYLIIFAGKITAGQIQLKTIQSWRVARVRQECPCLWIRVKTGSQGCLQRRCIGTRYLL